MNDLRQLVASALTKSQKQLTLAGSVASTLCQQEAQVGQGSQSIGKDANIFSSFCKRWGTPKQ
jgi:hypothetical protein